MIYTHFYTAVRSNFRGGGGGQITVIMSQVKPVSLSLDFKAANEELHINHYPRK